MAKEELSASQKQLEDKAKRMKDMIGLARVLTREDIEELLHVNSQATDKEIIQHVKDNPINIKAFLHEYCANLVESVSLDTAKTYYDHFSKRIKKRRTFIEVIKKGAKIGIGFHLNDNLIQSSISELRHKLSKKA